MVRTFYLSDTAYSWIKSGAQRDRVTLGGWVQNHYKEWLDSKFVIKDSGLVELIEERERLKENRDDVVARNDVPKSKIKGTPAAFDGVVYNAMFGSWGRRARELSIDDEVIDSLAQWVAQEGVVTRRASSKTARAGLALELFGRGWVDDNGDS